METPNTLTDVLESAATPAELKGKVQALLQDTIPVPQAKELAKHLRCYWHLEAAEEEEVEGQAGHRRRQRGQSGATVVETAEELYPPAALSKATEGTGG